MHRHASSARTCVDGLGAIYVVEAVGPLDISIADGEFVSIVGPSGCGKSTLLRIVAGLLNPSSGQVRVRVQGAAPLSMVFQDYGVYPWKRVIDNVRFGLDCSGVPRAEAQRRAEDWLERIQLAEFDAPGPTSCRGACASGWRWRAQWRSSLRFSSLTNPSLRSIRSCGWSCRTSCCA